MVDVLARVRKLIGRGEVRVSLHGFRELAADGILLDDILGGIEAATIIEEYPRFLKGPCVLVLQFDGNNRPAHVVWHSEGSRDAGRAGDCLSPDPERWSADFMRRRKQ